MSNDETSDTGPWAKQSDWNPDPSGGWTSLSGSPIDDTASGPPGPAKRSKRTIIGWVAAGEVGAVAALAGLGAVVDDNQSQTFTVSRVVDGDTLVIDDDGDRKFVELLNIDTPDLDDPDQRTECLAKESAAFTRRMAPTGTAVTLTFDKQATDKRGHDWAVVKPSGGKSVARELALYGLGIPTTSGVNRTYFEPVATAFRQAQKEHRGYFDPTTSCTIPAQEETLQQDVSKSATASVAATDPGLTAAQEAAIVAAIYGVYKSHSETYHLIRRGVGFAVRAMLFTGSRTWRTSYISGMTAISSDYKTVKRLQAQRQASEDKAFEEEMRRKIAEGEAAAQRAFEKRAQQRQEQEGGSSDDFDGDLGEYGDNTGDSGHPCLPGERDGDGDGYCGET